MENKSELKQRKTQNESSPKTDRKKKKQSKSKKEAQNIVEKVENLSYSDEDDDIELKKSIQRLNALNAKMSRRARRHQGDGESVPDTPPNEGSPSPTPLEVVTNTVASISMNPFGFNMEVDMMAVVLFILGVATRMYRLEDPRHIVFDELHYGKYAGMYMKRTFFFDSHPPFGKQLIAFAAYLAGFDGTFKFDRIGSQYSAEIPVTAMRMVPAMFGSLLIPTIYQVGVEIGLSHWGAAIAGLLALFENALLTQSRYILMESILLFFAVFGLLCILKFKKYHKEPFSFWWWSWLVMGATSLTCAVCVKYVGMFSVFLGLWILGREYWHMIGNYSLNNRHLMAHLVARWAAFCLLPLVIYFSIFYVHLSVLTKAGPHDNIMTSAFQASLEGGLASITKGQPLEIVHGSQITLRHTHGRACWMHSHMAVYPVRYPDGRGSSHQQQVTCYSFKDINNWWIVKLPDSEDLVVSEPRRKIAHGDIIQLVHGMSSRALNSHDVAAPVTPTNQEVSCYIDYNVSMPAQNFWRVEIINRDAVGDIWHTIESQVRLIHVNTSQALKFSGKQLPEWGYNQHEMVTDRLINQEDTIWNVEEHRYTKGGNQKDRELELSLAEMIPQSPTQLSFWEKMLELQLKMLLVNQETVQSHMYQSYPTEWPALQRGIAYWVSPSSNAQVHLLGNAVSWHTGTVCVAVYGALLVFYLLRRRRACYDLPEDTWQGFLWIGEVLFGGYLMHYIPYFFADRTLFLHHYLPAYVFKILLIAAVLEHLRYIIRNLFKWEIGDKVFCSLVVVWMLSVVWVFWKYSVFSYGVTPLSAQQVRMLRWKESWDFIIHKP